MVLQVGERDLFFLAGPAGQAEHVVVGAERVEPEQALIDVADLLDVQRGE